MTLWMSIAKIAEYNCCICSSFIALVAVMVNRNEHLYF